MEEMNSQGEGTVKHNKVIRNLSRRQHHHKTSDFLIFISHVTWRFHVNERNLYAE
ncbi:unnamed protein product [Chironomus riparius]|uniref:Uncharacterized protein n=1 Tax=Chironomus riparius TaxID=315576 RepID=A0A9N9S5G9_9DIPT|nr:unnamed protein product [Chironomus riparius]